MDLRIRLVRNGAEFATRKSLRLHPLWQKCSSTCQELCPCLGPRLIQEPTKMELPPLAEWFCPQQVSFQLFQSWFFELVCHLVENLHQVFQDFTLSVVVLKHSHHLSESSENDLKRFISSFSI
ncbi:hypothetical protein AVEN_39448-1 [Araneus ventricosus]|uniref:Uncharacterized protein n=1 Tax=Araneus ventricosus TaxID=182803 RepID=A0A4Y2VSE7_ARAVE|nr:hypothetical protein AVEN_39448-1 [Araneus ventricosus]